MRSPHAVHRVRLDEPLIGEHEVVFGWDVTPNSDLYQANGFRLSFPPELDLASVPRSLWLRLALICLHPHWALLRPCRVELPFHLGYGEREFWLRLTEVVAVQLEAYGEAKSRRPALDLLDEGPTLRPAPILARSGRVAASFSGGKDSLTQSALLAELTDRPLLVTTTSPVPWANDHIGAARARVMAEITGRLPVELVEVRSDFRACWDNAFPSRQGCLLSVNELTDVLLYQATTIAVAAASGITRSFMASEADLQYNVSGNGEVIQHGHFASSAVTHGALDRLLRAFGLRLGSITYPLHTPQVQALLWRRYHDLTDLQFSCWQAADGGQACSTCAQCIEIALLILAQGLTPRRAGIDPVQVLAAWAEPRPNQYQERAPRLHPTRSPRDKLYRILQGMPVECVAAILSADPVARKDDRLQEALDAYQRLRERAARLSPPPAPGYITGFLELVDDDLRGGLRTILDQYFTAAPADEFAPMVGRSRSLARWIADPLTRRAPTRGDAFPPDAGAQRARSVPARPRPLAGGCSAHGSAGAMSLVERFERAFGETVGCDHVVACSSLTAALELALGASSIGRGDEVILPTFAPVAVANAVMRRGAVAVLVDAEPETWNLDSLAFAARISDRTRALVVFHTYGHPAPMESVIDFADRNGLRVIECCATALGAEYRGTRVGAIGTAGVFSLSMGELLDTGTGAMLTTRDEVVAAIARELRDPAREMALDCRISELQAEVGLGQLDGFDDRLERCRATARRYRERLAVLPGLTLGSKASDVRTASTTLGVLVEDEFRCTRDELRSTLAAQGVETARVFTPIHLLDSSLQGLRYPVAERLYRHGLCLPIGPELNDGDIDRIVAEIATVASPVRQTP